MSGEQMSIPGLDQESTESTLSAPQSVSEVSAGSLTPRGPGWALLAPSDGLWHRTASRAYDGVLTAVCGRQGRYVDEAEHEIICCPACESAVT